MTHRRFKKVWVFKTHDAAGSQRGLCVIITSLYGSLSPARNWKKKFGNQTSSVWLVSCQLSFTQLQHIALNHRAWYHTSVPWLIAARNEQSSLQLLLVTSLPCQVLCVQVKELRDEEEPGRKEMQRHHCRVRDGQAHTSPQ